MGQVTGVFVNQTTTLEDLVEILSSLLGIFFRKLNLPDEPLYRSFIDDTDIEIDIFGNHGLEDDCGISFTSYDFEIRLESPAQENNQAQCLENRHVLC